MGQRSGATAARQSQAPRRHRAAAHHRNEAGQRDRARRHADVDRGTARRGPLDAHHPRRPRRRRDAHRHGRRLPPRRGRGRAQRVAHRQGARCLVGRPRRRAGRDEGRPPAARRRLVDPRRPARAPQEAARASLQRLGGEAIGLYQFHRPDPEVPYAESVGALADLLDAGIIEMAGISNADPEQIREAQRVLGGRLVLGAEPVLAGLPQQPSRSSTSAPSSDWPSCRGARSVASRRRPTSAAHTTRSPTSHVTAA